MVDDETLKRIEKEAAALLGNSAPSGRALVHSLAPTIEGLRAKGASWQIVATAIERSGVRQPDGSPISLDRLRQYFAEFKRLEAGKGRNRKKEGGEP